MKTKKILILVAIIILILVVIFFWTKGDQDVTETQPVAILQFTDSSQPYYLNKYGRIIATDDMNNNVFYNFSSPIFYDSRDADLNDQSHVDFFERLLMFIGSDALTQNGIYLANVNLSDVDDVFDAKIMTTEGWQIFINSETDLSQGLSNLPALLQEEIGDRSNLEYIDLRYGDKMFYKLKSF